MTQPPIAPKPARSKWASLWGAQRSSDEVEKLRQEHAAADAERAQRAQSGDGITDVYGNAAAVYDEDEDADGNPIQHPEYTLRVAGYGGVTVKKAHDPTSALLSILAVCETNMRVWEATLTRFGVLVAQLDSQPAVSHFVRRTRDGMTLAVPDARTRRDAILQIIQALLELQVRHRAVLEAAGIHAFRNG